MPKLSHDDITSIRNVTKRFKTRPDAEQIGYPNVLDPVAISAFNPVQMMVPTNAADAGPPRLIYPPEYMPSYVPPNVPGTGTGTEELSYPQGYVPTYLPSHDMRQGIPAVSSASPGIRVRHHGNISNGASVNVGGKQKFRGPVSFGKSYSVVDQEIRKKPETASPGMARNRNEDPMQAPEAEDAGLPFYVDYLHQGDIDRGAKILYGGEEMYEGPVTFGGTVSPGTR